MTLRRWLMPTSLGAAVLLAAAGGAALWATSAQKNTAVAKALTGGDPARAPMLIRKYGCGGCHTISALNGADGKVAPPLDRMRERVYIGGVAENSPDNMVRWIVSPHALSPKTAMPETGISEAEARDVAAFLYAN